MARKIIQITRGYLGNDYVDPNTLTALCDDGTLLDLNNGEWTRLPDIPQDKTPGATNE